MKKIFLALFISLIILSGKTALANNPETIKMIYIHGVNTRTVDKPIFYRDVINLNNDFIKESKRSHSNVKIEEFDNSTVENFAVYWGDLREPTDIRNLNASKLINEYDHGMFSEAATDYFRAQGQFFVQDMFWAITPDSIVELNQRISSKIPQDKPWMIAAHSAGSVITANYLLSTYMKSNPNDPIWKNFRGIITFGSPINYVNYPAVDIKKLAIKMENENKLWYHVNRADDPIAAPLYDDKGEIITNLNQIIKPDGRFGIWVNPVGTIATIGKFKIGRPSHDEYWVRGELVKIISHKRIAKEVTGKPYQKFFAKLNEIEPNKSLIQK